MPIGLQGLQFCHCNISQQNMLEQGTRPVALLMAERAVPHKMFAAILTSIG